MSGIPGLKVKTDIPPGGWAGPTLAEVGPDPIEEGVTRFIVHVKYHGGFQPNPKLTDALKGCQNLISLGDAIRNADAWSVKYEAAEREAVAAQERYSAALRRVNALVDERVRRETARAHQRANAAEAELKALRQSLAVVGRSLGMVQEP